MKRQTRIEAIIDMLPNGHCVADIGTDHGYLAINAIKSGKVQAAIASDISEKSLEKAKANICESGYRDKIRTCVANGFQNELFGDIDLAILAGMGGDLITRIWNQSTEKLDHIKACIVQPMTKIETVRKWVLENPFCISDEELVLEKGKLYFIFKIEHQSLVQSEHQVIDEIGTILIEKQHPLLFMYTTRKIVELELTLSQLNKAESDKVNKQKNEVLGQLEKMRELKSWSAAFKRL